MIQNKYFANKLNLMGLLMQEFDPYCVDFTTNVCLVI